LDSAYADSNSVTFLYAENLDFDGEVEDYDTENLHFARGITVYFEVISPYYTIYIYNSLAQQVNNTDPLEPDSNNIAAYQVNHNGALTIRCYATDNEGVIMEGIYDDIQVRSDNLSPKEPDINLMQEWVRYENGYLVQIDHLNEDNGSSGAYKADIKTVYEDLTEEQRTIMSPTSNDAFMIYQECDIYITVYDYAGNKKDSEFSFDKFDSSPPLPPQFDLTPNVEIGEQTNGYARSYSVTINFGEDDKSGIDYDSMKYTINGQLYDYEGGFNLNEQKNYTLTAYYKDNAANTSDTASINVDNIDRTEPSINSKSLHIDLRKENPYKLRLQCTDGMSGVEGIETEGINAEFEKRQYNWYEASFTDLDVSSINIRVSDNVENVTTTNILTHHFGDLDIRDLAEDYNDTFLAVEEEEYSQRAWENILDLYSELNIMLMTEDTPMSDFDNITSRIDTALLGQVEYRYSIRTVPEGIRTGISYEIDEEDLFELRKGDVITLILDEASSDADTRDAYKNTAKTLSDYEKCFARPFMLSFNYNGEPLEHEFENGVTITIPVPYGYEARYFEIIDLDEEQKIESQTINNQINFTINSAGVYAMIVEGEKIIEEEPQIRGLKVFGKVINWGAVGGSLAGIVVLAGGLITFLTIRYKKQK
ncbi:MAG: hypothetical protein ACOCWI_05065, partial [Bacillota bacterium]